MLHRFPLLAMILGACGMPQTSKDVGTDTDGSGDTDDGVVGTDTDGARGTLCDYPEGAVEPMALHEVLSPYRWAKAIHGDGRQAPLDLGFVPCAGSDDIEWSPFDVLVFVSIPAW